MRTLAKALNDGEFFAEIYHKARTVGHRLQCVERDIHEIKTETKNLATALQQPNKLAKDLQTIKAAVTKPVKSWTEIARVQSPQEQTHVHVKHDTNPQKRQEQEGLRQTNAKLTIVLTTTSVNKEIRNQIASMHEKEITKRCQQAITASTLDTKPKLQGVNKLTNGGIRILQQRRRSEAAKNHQLEPCVRRHHNSQTKIRHCNTSSAYVRHKLFESTIGNNRTTGNQQPRH